VAELVAGGRACRRWSSLSPVVELVARKRGQGRGDRAPACGSASGCGGRRTGTWSPFAVVEREVATAGVSAPGGGWSSCLWSPSPTRDSGCRPVPPSDWQDFTYEVARTLWNKGF